MNTKLDIIAHRGASGYCPDNSYESIHKAIKMGSKVIEIDIRLTKDHKIVLGHEDIYVVNNIKNPIGNTRLCDLDNIVKLDDILITTPEYIIFYLDIKCKNDENIFVVKINNILKKYPKRLFYIASFSKTFITIFSSNYNNYRLGLIIDLFDEQLYSILKHKLDFVVSKISQSDNFINFLEIDKTKYIYTVNNLTLIDEYINQIDGIITDYPDIMLLG